MYGDTNMQKNKKRTRVLREKDNEQTIGKRDRF
jgi:hypothetical protein